MACRFLLIYQVGDRVTAAVVKDLYNLLDVPRRFPPLHNPTRAREIYDVDEPEAWNTFIHEVIEIKLRSALRPYRILVNKLIEGYQEVVDGEKDRFIESLNEVFEVFRGSPPSS